MQAHNRPGEPPLADRDALAPYVRKGAIHCFIVAKLMDVDEPGRERWGEALEFFRRSYALVPVGSCGWLLHARPLPSSQSPKSGVSSARWMMRPRSWLPTHVLMIALEP